MSREEFTARHGLIGDAFGTLQQPLRPLAMTSRSRNTIAGIPLFRSLNAAALAALEGDCTWERVAAGETVIAAHGQGNDLFFVLYGRLRVMVSIANRETILRDLREGDHFGELAAIDGQPRSAEIRALTDSELARMPAATFLKAVYTHEDVCGQLLAFFVRQIRALTDRANEWAGLQLKERLWSELLRMARPAIGGPGCPVISPPPTHMELAARVGSYREAVTRELNVMERQGLIARRRGAIALVNESRIRELLEQATERVGRKAGQAPSGIHAR